MSHAKILVRDSTNGVSPSAVALWTPGVIAWVTFLLGFPSGIVLAAVNWYRMGMRGKANLHLLAGGLGLLVELLVFSILRSGLDYWVGFLVNILVLTYLRFRMKEDIERFKRGQAVRNANWLGGFGLGIGVLVFWVVAFMMLVFLVTLVYTLSTR